MRPFKDGNRLALVRVEDKAPWLARPIHNRITDNVSPVFGHNLINTALDVFVFSRRGKRSVCGIHGSVQILNLMRPSEHRRTMVAFIKKVNAQSVCFILLMKLVRLMLGTLHHMLEVLENLHGGKALLLARIWTKRVKRGAGGLEFCTQAISQCYVEHLILHKRDDARRPLLKRASCVLKGTRRGVCGGIRDM